MPPSIPILAYRGTANHCLCAACLFDACSRLLQFSLQVSDLPVLQALYNTIVKGSCGDLITTSAVAIQMGQERSASHVSRQPHKSRVLPAYSSNARPPTRISPASLTAQSPLHSTPVRSLTAFHHCAVPTALRPTRSSNCVDTCADQLRSASMINESLR